MVQSQFVIAGLRVEHPLVGGIDIVRPSTAMRVHGCLNPPSVPREAPPPAGRSVFRSSSARHEVRERRIASEARRSLTKFISTIAIAVFLEALVTVFRVSARDVTQLLYPTLLLVAATLLIIGLGLYQRLSATVERQVDANDRSAERKD